MARRLRLCLTTVAPALSDAYGLRLYAGSAPFDTGDPTATSGHRVAWPHRRRDLAWRKRSAAATWLGESAAASLPNSLAGLSGAGPQQHPRSIAPEQRHRVDLKSFSLSPSSSTPPESDGGQSDTINLQGATQ